MHTHCCSQLLLLDSFRLYSHGHASSICSDESAIVRHIRNLQASPASNMGTPLSTKSSSRWSKSKTAKKIMSMKECTSIVDGLKIIYFTKVCTKTLQTVDQARM